MKIPNNKNLIGIVNKFASFLAYLLSMQNLSLCVNPADF